MVSISMILCLFGVEKCLCYSPWTQSPGDTHAAGFFLALGTFGMHADGMQNAICLSKPVCGCI